MSVDNKKANAPREQLMQVVDGQKQRNSVQFVVEAAHNEVAHSIDFPREERSSSFLFTVHRLVINRWIDIDCYRIISIIDCVRRYFYDSKEDSNIPFLHYPLRLWVLEANTTCYTTKIFSPCRHVIYTGFVTRSCTISNHSTKTRRAEQRFVERQSGL